MQDFFDSERVEFSSSQLQYSYLGTLDTKADCPAIYEIFHDNVKNLDRTARRLEDYARASRINDESFNLLKRLYTLEQLRYWLLSGQAKELCEEEFVRLLYFYSTDELCPRCGDQQFVLDYLKKTFGQKLLIFAIDETLKEPMVTILKRQHEMTEFPTLIIEDDKISGFIGKDKLFEDICARIEFDDC